MHRKSRTCVCGRKGKIWVFNKQGQKLFYAKRINGLYYCKPHYPKIQNRIVYEDNSKVEILASESNDNLVLWHNRYNHVNTEYISQMSNNDLVRGIPKIKPVKINCEDCKLAKSRRVSFKPIPKIRSSKPLELLHMDVAGPMDAVSLGGSKYFLTIIDDFSRKVVVYPMTQKSEVFDCFKNFKRELNAF